LKKKKKKKKKKLQSLTRPARERVPEKNARMSNYSPSAIVGGGCAEKC
jgi:hypothetical protein